jgi:hypothetical protein
MGKKYHRLIRVSIFGFVPRSPHAAELTAHGPGL